MEIFYPDWRAAFSHADDSGFATDIKVEILLGTNTNHRWELRRLILSETGKHSGD